MLNVRPGFGRCIELRFCQMSLSGFELLGQVEAGVEVSDTSLLEMDDLVSDGEVCVIVLFLNTRNVKVSLSQEVALTLLC